YALFATNVQFDTGFKLGLYAFTAAVLGGIGNLPGAVLGAICIGLIEQFNNGLEWHTPGTDWTNSLIFAVLILILVFRPEALATARREGCARRAARLPALAVRQRPRALLRPVRRVDPHLRCVRLHRLPGDRGDRRAGVEG